MSRARIAFQGEAGAFGEDAVLRHWAGAALAIPARTFEDALAMVLSGRCDGAVLPVWNSTVGEVGPAREALREAGAALNVDTELMIPVRHCLAALPGAGLDQIRYVASHPVALSQCARFLRDHDHMIACDAYDTAGAARELAQLGARAGANGSRANGPRVDGSDANGALANCTLANCAGANGSHSNGTGDAPAWHSVLPHARPEELAVISSRRAAERHGLEILLESVQDDPRNGTKFVVVGRLAESDARGETRGSRWSSGDACRTREIRNRPREVRR